MIEKSRRKVFCTPSVAQAFSAAGIDSEKANPYNNIREHKRINV